MADAVSNHPDPRRESVAIAIHRHLNSGVDAPDSPLTWEKEPEAMKEWHQRIADAAIVAADAVDPLRRKWDVDYEDGQPVVARRQIGPIIAERDALYRVLAALIAGWDALPYNWSVVVRCEDDARRLLAETGPT